METTLNENATPTGYSSRRVLLWISIASIVMLFAGLTSGYIVRQSEGNWRHFDLPFVFYISTAIILLSSLTMHLTLRSAKNNDFQGVKRFAMITLGLGFGFVFSQFLGWNELVKQGVYFVDKTTPSGSFFFVLSGLHLAHLFFGVLALIITTVQAIRQKYNSDSFEGISLCATYWHFLDGLWIYLFVFLAVYR